MSLGEDNALAITLSSTDPNGDPLSYAVTQGPSSGWLSEAARISSIFPMVGSRVATAFSSPSPTPPVRWLAALQPSSSLYSAADCQQPICEDK